MLLTDRQTHTHTHTHGRTDTQSDRNKPLAGFNNGSIDFHSAFIFIIQSLGIKNQDPLTKAVGKKSGHLGKMAMVQRTFRMHGFLY